MQRVASVQRLGYYEGATTKLIDSGVAIVESLVRGRDSPSYQRLVRDLEKEHERYMSS